LKIAQALLVETGAVQDPSKLPASFTQAKSLLKSSVHINILDYLQVRKSGLEAIREVLFKSLQELRRDIRDPSRRAALKKVKKLGLNQLLAI
ncbi:uncharacterized protein EI90DRAFT_2924866, partial [Cantharellus anzutake]|uniref:uncharacterized protein n=1 Tax=Cantharellus anzutake TaxID=1750568 RepID=UPI001903CFDF